MLLMASYLKKRNYEPLQTSGSSSDLSSQSPSPSQVQRLGMHLRDALHWKRVTGSQVWLWHTLGDSSLSSPQSLPPSHSLWRDIQRPFGHVCWSLEHVVGLQWSSSELSAQSFFPSHTCDRNTHLLFAHLNWKGAHCRDAHNVSSAPLAQSLWPLQTCMIDTHVVLSHWNIPEIVVWNNTKTMLYLGCLWFCTPITPWTPKLLS